LTLPAFTRAGRRWVANHGAVGWRVPYVRGRRAAEEDSRDARRGKENAPDSIQDGGGGASATPPSSSSVNPRGREAAARLGEAFHQRTANSSGHNRSRRG